MKFNISKSIFENVLKNASKYLEKSHDTLKFVFIGVSDGKLSIRGSNNTEDSISYPESSDLEDGSCLVDSALLIRGLNSLADESIVVNINKKLSISQGRKKYLLMLWIQNLTLCFQTISFNN